MAERERVKRAIEAPVDEAAKLLSESSSADLEARLAMRIDGWGRGLAAGIEELAVSLADLRRRVAAPDEPSESRSASASADHADGAEADAERAEQGARTEDELRAGAARSREATSALREESDRSSRDVSGDESTEDVA